MAAGPSGLVSLVRSRPVRRASLVVGVALTVGLLALAVPAAQEAQYAHQCTELGGSLQRSTEAVEPLVTARTVHRCLGPGGEVLEQW